MTEPFVLEIRVDIVANDEIHANKINEELLNQITLNDSVEEARTEEIR